MDNRTKEMMEKFEAAVDRAKFSKIAMLGFAAKPRLALLAGISIGYQLGLEDAVRHFDEVILSKRR